MRRQRRLGSIAILVLFAALPAAAEPRNLLRVGAQWTQPTDEEGFDGVTLEVEYSLGAVYAWELLITPQIGVEVSYSSASHDVLRVTSGPYLDVGGLRVSPATLMVNLHSQTGTRANLFVGAGVAYTSFGDLELRSSDGATRWLGVEEDFVPAVQFGLELPITRCWAVSLGSRYLEAKAKTDEGTLPIKPWTYWLGVRFAI